LRKYLETLTFSLSMSFWFIATPSGDNKVKYGRKIASTWTALCVNLYYISRDWSDSHNSGFDTMQNSDSKLLTYITTWWNRVVICSFRIPALIWFPGVQFSQGHSLFKFSIQNREKIFEMPIVAQLVKKCPIFQGTRRSVHYRVHKSTTGPILSQFNPVHNRKPISLRPILTFEFWGYHGGENEDGDSMYPRNVGIFLRVYTAS
jgi:hypothetical protein